jgi:uncharacterized protein (DUF342 family)
MEKQLLEAAVMHFRAIKLREEANLSIYLKHSSGIGEHPDILSEIIKLTQQINEAEECIVYLEKRLSRL